jgi:anti-sigma regulatory factor (Ser/Thr protein kinase)/anti-anti-sigma regulatory factor
MHTTADIDVGSGIARVALTGHLDLAGATAVRRVLLKCLAQAPTVILVDLAGISVSDRRNLAVFTAIARQHYATDAPVPVLLHSVPAAVAIMLTRAGRAGVKICATADDALSAAAVGQAAGRRQTLLPLLATPDAPARARGMITTVCRDWDIDHLQEPALVIISELVTNAVEHTATSTIMVTAVLGRHYLHLQVADTDARRHFQHRPVGLDHRDPQQVRGRGLHLVEVYASSWGVNPSPDGKTVWARLRATPI